MTTSRSRTSHTVELAFRLPLDFPHGKIANVPGILMKVGETTRGVPLNGVSVKVADDLFRIYFSMSRLTGGTMFN